MTKETLPNVIVDKNSTYGKKAAPVITSQGTPEHNKDPQYTMSAHDKAEQFISKMNVIKAVKIKETKPQKSKSKIQKIKKKLRGVKR
tara:strand:+ start:918 stop:1178 length:261 start_codon:yes stop_codon:yes gene_type:complete